MSRPLRITFPGAIYHMTSRGNAQAAIYADDADRRAFLDSADADRPAVSLVMPRLLPHG